MSAPRQNPLNAGYDESLLAAAPVASKAAKQEGYNVDLLDQPRPVRGNGTPRSDPEAARYKENYNTLNSPVDGVSGKVPFWRTRGGIIGLAVLAIVIVGAIVGGAVGGTVGKNKSSNNGTESLGSAPASTTNGTTIPSATQGVGLAPNSSTPDSIAAQTSHIFFADAEKAIATQSTIAETQNEVAVR